MYTNLPIVTRKVKGSIPSLLSIAYYLVRLSSEEILNPLDICKHAQQQGNTLLVHCIVWTIHYLCSGIFHGMDFPF